MTRASHLCWCKKCWKQNPSERLINPRIPHSSPFESELLTLTHGILRDSVFAEAPVNISAQPSTQTPLARKGRRVGVLLLCTQSYMVSSYRQAGWPQVGENGGLKQLQLHSAMVVWVSCGQTYLEQYKHPGRQRRKRSTAGGHEKYPF